MDPPASLCALPASLRESVAGVEALRAEDGEWKMEKTAVGKPPLLGFKAGRNI